MIYGAQKNPRITVAVYAIAPTLLLLKYVLESWWDVIDSDHILQHLLDRNKGVFICFYEPPPFIFTLLYAIFLSAICGITLSVLSYKLLGYQLYKILLYMALIITLAALIVSIPEVWNKPIVMERENFMLLALIFAPYILWRCLRLWKKDSIKNLFLKGHLDNIDLGDGKLSDPPEKK